MISVLIYLLAGLMVGQGIKLWREGQIEDYRVQLIGRAKDAHLSGRLDETAYIQRLRAVSALPHKQMLREFWKPVASFSLPVSKGPR